MRFDINLQNYESFDVFLSNKLSDSNMVKTYHEYLGIHRTEHPKWPGWKIINKMKTDNQDFGEYNNTLQLLAMNFYFIQYLNDVENIRHISN